MENKEELKLARKKQFIEKQNNLINDVNFEQEIENYLYRTLLLERIRKDKQKQYDEEFKKLEQERSQLSNIEKFKTREEFNQKINKLKENNLELEIKTYREYEKFLQDLYAKDTNDTNEKEFKFKKNVMHTRQYQTEFESILENEFSKYKNELDNDLNILSEKQGLSRREGINHLFGVTTNDKSLSKKLDDIYSKDSIDKMKANVTKGIFGTLKGVSFAINPASFVLREVISKVAEIPVMKSMVHNINSRFDEALDLIGMSAQNKKYVKIAASVTLGIAFMGLTGHLMLPDTLNANELMSGLSDLKTSLTEKATEAVSQSNVTEKASEVLSQPAVNEKMEAVKGMIQSSNVGEEVDMVKQAVANTTELPKTAFTDGLKDHLNVVADKAEFKPTDLVVNNPDIKVPETYNDISQQDNYVMDPAKAEALHQARVTGEVADILKQDAILIEEPKVATPQDVLSDLNGDNTNTSVVDQQPEVAQQSTTPTMEKYVIQKGDTLSGIVEKLDSKEFDLQGEKLYAVVQLIAEQNGITNPHHILAGASIDIPQDTAALQAYCEANKDKLSEIMGREFIQSAQPVVTPTVSIELPSHTQPVSVSPNGITQLGAEIELPNTVPVIEVPKEMLAQNSRLIASEIIEGMPKEEVDKFLSKGRLTEEDLLSKLSEAVERQVLSESPNGIIIEANQNREELEKLYNRSISDSMMRRLGATLELPESLVINSIESVEKELSTVINQNAANTIKLPESKIEMPVLSNGSVTPEGTLQIRTEIDKNGKEFVVHKTIPSPKM